MSHGRRYKDIDRPFPFDPDEKTYWLIIPNRDINGGPFAPMVEGTLAEALKETLEYAYQYRMGATLMRAPGGRYHGTHTMIAVVSVAKQSGSRPGIDFGLRDW
jgi:hypothetical protein